MEAKDLITPLVSITAVILSWRLGSGESRKRSLTDHLRGQLEGLYGPLVFLIRTNSAIWAHHRKLSEFSDKEHGEKARINWNDDAQVERNSAEIEIAIVLGNDFGSKAVKNNQLMVELIRKQYHLLDVEDQAICQSLALNVVRLELEETSKLAGRLRGFAAANRISLHDPLFTTQIEASFDRKKRQLDELLTDDQRGPIRRWIAGLRSTTSPVAQISSATRSESSEQTSIPSGTQPPPGAAS